MENETYQNNGFTFKEAINEYGAVTSPDYSYNEREHEPSLLHFFTHDDSISKSV